MTVFNNQKTDREEFKNRRDDSSSIIPKDSPFTEPGPTTNYESRKVILRSEHGDTISLGQIEQQFIEREIPSEFTVVKRTETYFGPELMLEANRRNYLLTAPGPDTQLLLWGENVDDRAYREGWYRLAEVSAEIDETPQYDICDQCGHPIRSQQHQRLSTLGRCPDG
jgi:hypothetical protein